MSRVIKIRRLPTGRDVTRAALTWIVIRGLIDYMTGRAIGESVVIERRGLPGSGGVARAAFARIVIGGFIRRMT